MTNHFEPNWESLKNVGVPDWYEVTIRSLAERPQQAPPITWANVTHVELLGGKALTWQRAADGLNIKLGDNKLADRACVFKISLV